MKMKELLPIVGKHENVKLDVDGEIIKFIYNYESQFDPYLEMEAYLVYGGNEDTLVIGLRVS